MRGPKTGAAHRPTNSRPTHREDSLRKPTRAQEPRTRSLFSLGASGNAEPQLGTPGLCQAAILCRRPTGRAGAWRPQEPSWGSALPGSQTSSALGDLWPNLGESTIRPCTKERSHPSGASPRCAHSASGCPLSCSSCLSLFDNLPSPFLNKGRQDIQDISFDGLIQLLVVPILQEGCDPPICRMARRNVFNPYHTPLRRLRLSNPGLRFSQRKSLAA